LKFLPRQAAGRKLLPELDQFGPIFISYRTNNLAPLIVQGSQGFHVRSLLAEKHSRAEQRHDPRRLTHKTVSLLAKG
jgi:hypothetical protein